MRHVIAFLLTVAGAATLVAQPQRTFVASNGIDTAACTRTAPCRNFAAAVSAVAGGGEVIVLDSAGYGPLTINKGVSIIAPGGVYAGVTAFAESAIVVLAGSSDSITLQGLILNALGGDFGVSAFTGNDLHIHDCLISGFDLTGILFDHNDTGYLFVRDTTIKNGGGDGMHIGAATTAVVSIDQVRLDGNALDGLSAVTNAQVTVSNSVASGNGAAGFELSAPLFAVATLSAINCVASDNGKGFRSAGGPNVLLRVARSAALNNVTDGFGRYNTTLFHSLGDNFVLGNTPNIAGTITTINPD